MPSLLLSPSRPHALNLILSLSTACPQLRPCPLDRMSLSSPIFMYIILNLSRPHDLPRPTVTSRPHVLALTLSTACPHPPPPRDHRLDRMPSPSTVTSRLHAIALTLSTTCPHSCSHHLDRMPSTSSSPSRPCPPLERMSLSSNPNNHHS